MLRKQKSSQHTLCQCPTSGFSHFYFLLFYLIELAFALCQCPTSGFSHFYRHRRYLFRRTGGCVNALHRASPISTLSDWSSPSEPTTCVNALHRASPISTLLILKLFYIASICVNALHRASPISTSNIYPKRL